MKLNCKYIRDIRANSVGKNGKALTREELSYHTELSFNTLYRLETDENFNTGILTIYKLAQYFNVSMDNFVV